ncbi:MAG: hypothetical protein WA906_00820, partial [Pacificimonas sp.]
MAVTRDDADYEETAGDDLPWLEPTEVEYAQGGGFLTRKAVIVGGLTIAAVVAVLWWLAASFGDGGIEIPEGGDIPLVEAPEGPYRIEPDDRGGMEMPDNPTVFDVSEGGRVPGDVDTDNIPEVPIPVTPPVGTGNADGPPRDLMEEARLAREDAAAAEAERATEAPRAVPPQRLNL